MLWVLVIYLPALVIGCVIIEAITEPSGRVSKREIAMSAEWWLGRTLDMVAYVRYKDDED